MDEWRQQLWTRAFELLRDGKWHNYEDTIRELGKVIPPGIAMRKQETERIKSKTNPRVVNGRVVPRDPDRMVESGRRTIVRVMFKHPMFESDRPGHTGHRVADRRIRLVKR